MQNLKRVRNITGLPQSIVYKGRQVVLKAATEELMDEGLATAFVNICMPHVEFVSEEEDTSYDPDSANEVVWLANVTGNPKFPKELEVRQMKSFIIDGRIRKQYVTETVANPSAEAHPVHRSYAPGDIPWTARDGSPLTKTLPPIEIIIPVGKRRPLKKEIGEWFLRREAASGLGHRGSVIRSRKPTSFEPDMGWTLDDMRAYLKLISSEQAELGPDELAVAKEARKKKPEAASALLKEAKEACLNNIWYYVCDPQYRLPTKQEFREYVTGKSAEELESDQAAKLLEQAEVSTRLVEA